MYHKDSTTKIPFNIPAIWTEPLSHAHGDCYFCSIERVSGRKKQAYFDCKNCQLPSSAAPLLKDFGTNCSTTSSSGEISDGSVFNPEEQQSALWLPSDFNDFCKELSLSKAGSLKCLKMLKTDKDIAAKLCSVKTRHIKERNFSYLNFFQTSGYFTYCSDINELLENLSADALTKRWCLFIDSSKSSLKSAVICENYAYPTVPVAYARVKEEKSSVIEVLKLLKYHSLNFPIVADLKVVNFLLGLPGGYAKHPCFYCMFDSRNSLQDFDINHVWPARCSRSEEQVPRANIVLPFLHIKLGLFQKFVKTLSKEGSCYEYLLTNSHKSQDKVANGVFTGPEIRKYLKDADFLSSMNALEKATWLAFTLLCENVLGKNISSNWSNLVDNFISSLHQMGCQKMSSKMHLLFKHKEQYQQFLGNFSDEHGERLHKDMELLETRYGHHLTQEMLADYIWSLKREGSMDFSGKNVYF